MNSICVYSPSNGSTTNVTSERLGEFLEAGWKVVKERCYTGPVNQYGAIVEVFGWYDDQAWTKVKLVRHTSRGWLVVPVDAN